MEAVFLKIFNMSISAGWLVLAVVVLRLLLTKAPKAIRVVLWGLVGLRLVWPFSIESVLSLIPSAETVPADIGMAKVPALQTGVPVLNASINPILGQTMAATPQYSANPMQILQAVAALVWVAGMVLMTLYALISWLVLRIRVREAMRETDNIWLCDRVGSPFILGLVRPRIYLPPDMAEGDKTYVLAHERAHLHRRDHWWKPLGFLLLTVHWFNPLVWLAYILLCRDIELACDERVVARLGEACKKPYSQALINCSVPRRMIAACPVAFGETGVKGRIRSVLHYKKPAFWVILVAIILCIAVAVCFLTDPHAPAQTTPEQDTHKPPALRVSDGSDAIQASRLGYDWSYQAEDGKTVHVIADSSRPTEAADLPLLELGPIGYSHRKGNTVLLDFEKIPDRITVTCYTPEGEQVVQTDGVQAFDLLEGTFVYGIEAQWETQGRSEYAFRGSFNMPKFGYIPSDIAVLRSQYPQYFDLPADKGLEVYIWQMAEGAYSCGLIPGTNFGTTDTQILALGEAPVSMEQMRLILSTYGLSREEVWIIPVRMPTSSYYYEIDEAYRARLERRFWGLDDWGVAMDMRFTSHTAFQLTISAATPPEGMLYTGSDYSVAKYGEDGTVELLAARPGVAWDLAAYTVAKGGQLTQDGDLRFVYGDLEPGTYQLQKVITCEYPNGATEERLYTCDFAITDE